MKNKTFYCVQDAQEGKTYVLNGDKNVRTVNRLVPNITSNSKDFAVAALPRSMSGRLTGRKSPAYQKILDRVQIILSTDQVV